MIINFPTSLPGYFTKKFLPQQGEVKMVTETYLSTLSKPFWFQRSRGRNFTAWESRCSERRKTPCNSFFFKIVINCYITIGYTTFKKISVKYPG